MQPDVRGAGVGRQLIDAVVQFAKSRDANRVYWMTQADNREARILYDRVATDTGFVIYRIWPMV